MAVDAYEYYNAAIVATRVSDEREYYNAAITPSRIGVESNEREYYNVNQLEDTLCNVNWFNTWEAETIWRPGTMFNGTEFRRYKMWDGTRWVDSCGDEPADPLSVYPTSVTSYKWDDYNSNAFLDLPAIPGGATSAVALIGTMRYREITLPSGWTLLGETRVGSDPINGSSSGQIRKAIAVAIDDIQGTESLRFNFTDEFTDNYNMKCFSCAYFSGGLPGTWNAVKGPEYSATSYANYTDIPLTSAPRIWWQTGILTAVYTHSASDVTDYSHAQNGFMPPFTKPAVGSSSGANFYARYLAGNPATSSNYIDSNNIGGYGQPNSTSWGFYWTPPV